MRVDDLLLTARHTFSQNRVRAALTLLGILIGTSSIVMLAGLLTSAQEALLRADQGANETDLIEVNRNWLSDIERLKATRPISRYDVAALDGNALLDDARVATAARIWGRARLHGREQRVGMYGVSSDAMVLYRLELEQGRMFVDDDLRARRRVAIVGQEVWSNLLEKKPIDGVSIDLNGELFRVVGVLKHKPTLGGGRWSWDQRVLLPHTTVAAIFQPSGEVASIFVRLAGTGSLGTRIEALTKVIDGVMLRRHFGVRNFEVKSAKSGGQEELILSIIAFLIVGTGGVALFVGGVNIMNIMLVTVAERTREIGVRRALGAPPHTILVQFLLEASALSLVGGLLGVVFGVVFSFAIVQALNATIGGWTFYVEAWSIFAGLGMSLLTGIVFGLSPAWRASKLSPVEALRSD
jgi:putative ABC transport system permease protein